MKAYYVEDIGLSEDEIADDGIPIRAKIYLAKDLEQLISDHQAESLRSLCSELDDGNPYYAGYVQTLKTVISLLGRSAVSAGESRGDSSKA